MTEFTFGEEANKSGVSDFQNPKDGDYQAVCCDVVDYGFHHSTYYGKTAYKVVLKFQLDPNVDKMDDGRPFMVRKMAKISFHEKSWLSSALKALNGRMPTDEEFSEFSGNGKTLTPTEAFRVIEKFCLGKNCYLEIEVKDGWSNITDISKFRGNDSDMMKPEGVIRDCDNPDWQGTITTKEEAVKISASRNNGSGSYNGSNSSAGFRDEKPF